MLIRLLNHLLRHKSIKKKNNSKDSSANSDHINYPLNSNHNLVIAYSFLDSSFLFFSVGKFSSQTLLDESTSSSFCWSPRTVVSGQNLNAGHFSQPTATARGQIIMWFTSSIMNWCARLINPVYRRMPVLIGVNSGCHRNHLTQICTKRHDEVLAVCKFLFNRGLQV